MFTKTCLENISFLSFLKFAPQHRISPKNERMSKRRSFGLSQLVGVFSHLGTDAVFCGDAGAACRLKCRKGWENYRKHIENPGDMMKIRKSVLFTLCLHAIPPGLLLQPFQPTTSAKSEKSSTAPTLIPFDFLLP